MSRLGHIELRHFHAIQILLNCSFKLNKKECTMISRGPPPSNGGETPSANPANCLGLRKVTEERTVPEFVNVWRAEESIPPALCSLAGGKVGQIGLSPGWELTPGLLKRFKNSSSAKEQNPPPLPWFIDCIYSSEYKSWIWGTGYYPPTLLSPAITDINIYLPPSSPPLHT